MDSNKKPTVYLNLFHFRFPATAIASMAHRISGVLLFLAIPFFLYLLELSLSSSMGFARACAWLDSLPVYLLLLVLLWALAHHLLAGLRFLLMDADIGIQPPREFQFHIRHSRAIQRPSRQIFRRSNCRSEIAGQIDLRRSWLVTATFSLSGPRDL